MIKHAASALIATTLLAGLPAHADLCLTFGGSTDLFRGQVTGGAPGGFITLAMIEETFDRATFGSIAVSNGKFNIGLTKNTNTAIVSYACQIDAVQLSGQCQIQVVSSSPLQGSRTDDVGFLELGCVAPAVQPSRGTGAPPGESL